MTELVDRTVEVRPGADGAPEAVRIGRGWRPVTRVAAGWRVETDWWRRPVSREYWRVLVEEDCLEIYRDTVAGTWHLCRRYD